MSLTLRTAVAAALVAGLSTAFAGTEMTSSKDKNVTQAAVAPECNFSGFYIGGNAGASWMHYDFEGLDFTVDQFNQFDGPVSGPFNGSVGTDEMEVALGGQIGYQWQFSRWVLGAEIDGQHLSDTNREARTNEAFVQGNFGPGNGSRTSVRIHRFANTDWMGTGRLRLGYTFNCLMIYVTGGVAAQDTSVDTDIHAITVATFAPPRGNTTIQSDRARSSDSATMIGYTVGAGIDWQVLPWARLGVEYRFADFGSENFGYRGSSSEGGTITGGRGGDLDMYNHQVTVRVNIPFSTFFGTRY